MITSDFRIKLNDFSCACSAPQKGTSHLGIAGTRGFIAPEL